MTNRKDIEDRLAEYIAVLSTATEETSYSADRPRYASHLAAAARMFSSVRLGDPVEDLRQLVENEQRNYGWGYLSGDCGERATSAFSQFASFVLGERAG